LSIATLQAVRDVYKAEIPHYFRDAVVQGPASVAPRVFGANLFDALCAFEVVVVNFVAAWFLLYRFLWRRELTVFHAAGAGIPAGRGGRFSA